MGVQELGYCPNVFNRIGGPCVVTTAVCYGTVCGTPTSEAAVVPLATGASRGPMDLDPANAIAIIKAAKIEPKMAFACSHRSNVRRSSGDSLL
jgi:hypothetical protein